MAKAEAEANDVTTLMFDGRWTATKTQPQEDLNGKAEVAKWL